MRKLYRKPGFHSFLCFHSFCRWWQQQDFFGIDFSSFFSTAAKEAFSMAVVGSFSPFILLSNPTVSTSSYTIDFRYATVPDLQE
jgi:hypothetical protein